MERLRPATENLVRSLYSADEVCGSAKDTDTISAFSEQRVSFEMRINFATPFLVCIENCHRKPKIFFIIFLDLRLTITISQIPA